MSQRAILAYLCFGLAVFVLVLIVRLPASLVPQFVHASTSDAQLRLTAPQGSLWRGEASIWVMQTDFGRIAWQVSPLSLLTLSPTIDWQLRATSLTGQVNLDDGSFSATLNGSLDLARLAPILSRYAMSAEGELRFEALQVERTEQSASISGQVHWSGGRVELGLGNWQGQQVLPALRARAADSSRLLITLRDDQSGAHVPASEIELLPDGWVKLGVTGHLAKYFSRTLGQANDPSEIVLSVEERLF